MWFVQFYILVHILENQLDNLVIFYAFTDITKVNQQRIAIHIGLLIFEFKNLDTIKQLLLSISISLGTGTAITFTTPSSNHLLF